MSVLGKDMLRQQLSTPDVAYEEVPVPEWGGSIRLKGLTGSERDAFEASIIQITGQGRHETRKIDSRNIRAKLLVLSIVDEKGERVFGDGDVAALGQKSALVLDRLFGVAQRLSGLGEDDVEKLAGNSETAPAGSSPSP